MMHDTNYSNSHGLIFTVASQKQAHPTPPLPFCIEIFSGPVCPRGRKHVLHHNIVQYIHGFSLPALLRFT